MPIVEFADYINGKKFLEPLEVEPFRGTLDILTLGKKLVQTYESAEYNLNSNESHTEFYKLEPDLAKDVSKEQREELFYGMKLGYVSPIIPAKGLYFLKRCHDLYNCLNLMSKVIPSTYFKTMLAKNYLAEGYSLRDVICSEFFENFKPVSEGEPAVEASSWWDIYIEKTDMIAMVPAEIKSLLSTSDIRALDVVGKDIVLHGHPIRYLSNSYIGVVESTYDLRTII